MASSKEPWELYPNLWPTKSKFFTYLRGQLRRLWSTYPAKLKWKQAQLVIPPKGYTGRAKKLGKCHYCNEMFAASHLEVDHVEMAGACSSWDEAAQFVYRLLDCNDNWVLACKPCHKVKSLAERKGIDFEEALLQKKVIEICKQPKQKVLDFCQQSGYDCSTLTNAERRRKAVEAILKGRK